MRIAKNVLETQLVLPLRPLLLALRPMAVPSLAPVAPLVRQPAAVAAILIVQPLVVAFLGTLAVGVSRPARLGPLGASQIVASLLVDILTP